MKKKSADTPRCFDRSREYGSLKQVAISLNSYPRSSFIGVYPRLNLLSMHDSRAIRQARSTSIVLRTVSHEMER
jgi:hypothetical protein